MTGAGGAAKRLGAVAVLAAAVWVPSPAATPDGVLSLKASLSMRGALTACAAPAPSTVACYSHAGAGVVSGLGAVSQTYVNVVDTAPPGCPAGSFSLPPTTVRLRVAGKGTLTLGLSESSTCSDSLGVLNLTRAFTITGGTGKLAGAAGSGHVKHAAAFTSDGTNGRDLYLATLAVSGIEFDTASPVLRGARSRIVVAPPGATSVRVRYRVTAYDEVEGAVTAVCRPRPGSRFHLGRTSVSCSASDKSGNPRRAKFTVTVERGIRREGTRR